MGAMRRFLVTAGNTREPIDSVRDWGNIFTGATGLAIAQALAGVGTVDLLTSNRQHIAELAAGPVRAFAFTTHADLREAVAGLVTKAPYDAIFMTAAVSDYRPAGGYAVVDRTPVGDTEVWTVRRVQAGKIKSEYPLVAFLGEKTEKLVDLFRTEWAYTGLLVKFKLEVDIGVDALLEIGENSRLASGADHLVANTLAMTRGPGAGAYLLSAGGHEWVGRLDLPRRMVRLVEAATERRRGE
jgi:phosphopantothenate---cysteine ligase (CTP)